MNMIFIFHYTLDIQQREQIYTKNKSINNKKKINYSNKYIIINTEYLYSGKSVYEHVIVKLINNLLIVY